jgi:hypothetical protein
MTTCVQKYGIWMGPFQKWLRPTMYRAKPRSFLTEDEAQEWLRRHGGVWSEGFEVKPLPSRIKVGQ